MPPDLIKWLQAEIQRLTQTLTELGGDTAQATPADPTLTVKQVAATLQATQESVLALIKSGDLLASNINTRSGAQRPRWRIEPANLAAFLERTRYKKPPRPVSRRRRPIKDYFADN